MRTLLVLVLVCIGIAPCFGGSIPSMTARVSTANGITSYLYTITNDTAAMIDTFSVFMPEAGARAVTSFTCAGTPLWNDYSFRGDGSMWAVGVDIAPGVSKSCTLTTSASVPTS